MSPFFPNLFILFSVLRSLQNLREEAIRARYTKKKYDYYLRGGRNGVTKDDLEKEIPPPGSYSDVLMTEDRYDNLNDF